MKPVLVDTGFLVALFKPTDLYAAHAAGYLRAHRHPLLTILPVVVESCHFLAPADKANLLEWIRAGGLSVAETPVPAYTQLEQTLRKYADRDIDLADAALVWLAGETGLRRILTVDRTDFSVYRVKGGKRFDLIDWY